MYQDDHLYVMVHIKMTIMKI